MAQPAVADEGGDLAACSHEESTDDRQCGRRYAGAYPRAAGTWVGAITAETPSIAAPPKGSVNGIR